MFILENAFENSVCKLLAICPGLNVLIKMKYKYVFLIIKREMDLPIT